MNNNKIALLIGINYNNTDNKLNGCINDVHNIKNVLINKFNYNPKNINMITDETSRKPTANNILYSIYEMLIRCHKDKNIKEIWFHYSGHGYYTRDHDNDEKDNQDECIVPLDYAKNGIISDDIIFKYFKWFPSHVNCVSIFDCCHAGTIMDLEYKYDFTKNSSIIETKKKINSKILCLSGCKDNQTSKEVLDFFEMGRYNGALTSTLILMLEDNDYNISIIDLLTKIKMYLKKHNFSQTPQLTSSYTLNSKDMFCIKPNKKSFIN